jgi:ribonucleotide monophosphatase NagD (HAD superfamily)
MCLRLARATIHSHHSGHLVTWKVCTIRVPVPAGSIVMLLEVATGVVPVSIGKPAPYLLEAAAHVAGRDPAEAIMIGDGIATDLAAAHAVGARSVLMLTGVTTRAEVEALPADQQPTAIAADAAELAATLDRLATG